MMKKCLFIVVFTGFLPAMEPEIPSLSDDERIVWQTYNPTPERCHISVNKNTPVIERGGREKFLEFACLVTGNKNIVWHDHSARSFLQDWRSMDSALKRLMQKKNIQEIWLTVPGFDGKPFTSAFFFNELAAKNALIFAILKLNPSVKLGQYLIGYLLQYPQEDIELFYALDSFLEYEEPNQSIGIGNFLEWPSNLKRKFFAYEKNDWPKSLRYQIFLEDKEAALQWVGRFKDVLLQEIFTLIIQRQRSINHSDKALITRLRYVPLAKHFEWLTGQYIIKTDLDDLWYHPFIFSAAIGNMDFIKSLLNAQWNINQLFATEAGTGTILDQLEFMKNTHPADAIEEIKQILRKYDALTSQELNH